MPRCLLALMLPWALAACTDPGAAGSGGSESTEGSEATSESESETGTDTGEDEPFPWPEEDLSALVDPMTGTGGLGYTVGTMNPGASLPFGMIKPGPDTGLGALQISFLNCTGYHYDQTHIWGFSHSRINGMGVPDYGAVLITPTLGMDPGKAERGGARSLFDHADEQAEAGYYAVTLDEVGVRAELTATTHAARHRYTWSEATEEATIVLDLGYGPADAASSASEITLDPATGTFRGMTTVMGSYSDRFGGAPTYFAGRVSHTPSAHGVWTDLGELVPGEVTFSGAEIGAWLGLSVSGPDDPVVLDLAISYVSMDEAQANLAELDGASFDETRAAAAAAWDEELHRVRVLGGSQDQRRALYSALYRTFLAPTTFSDKSGAYRGFDGEAHQAEDFTYYSDFSLWDTYRTLHPLLNLIQRERSADMMQSLVTMAAQGGDLPKWPLAIGYTGGMVGTSADIVLADAWLRGIEGFDVEAAYTAARLHALEPRPNAGRGGILGYVEQGWVASDQSGGSASRTLEFAHADYALSRLAAALGHPEDAEMFAASAGNWRNLWDPDLAYLIGRRADGSFESEGFDPEVWQDYYAEGTAHHYLWAAPHDVAGLVELMGGVEPARERLAAYFETSKAFLTGPEYNPLEPVPFYWQSNEPSLHDAYLFTELGDPASTQRWVAWARERHYGLGPDGLPGNDDAGTMSAWYAWSAIGLYPLPAGEGYWITAPIFERIELDLGDAAQPDRRLTILAEGAGPGAIYVSEARFDGEALPRPWIAWDMLREGGTLELSVSDQPSSFGAR